MPTSRNNAKKMMQFFPNHSDLLKSAKKPEVLGGCVCVCVCGGGGVPSAHIKAIGVCAILKPPFYEFLILKDLLFQFDQLYKIYHL